MKTIKITSTGKASATPDQIEVKINLSTPKKEYADCLATHESKIDKLQEIIIDLGFEQEDLKTYNFDIRQDYTNSKNLRGEYQQKITGYIISQSLTLSFDLNIRRLDKLVAAIANSKINPKISFAFTVKDKEEFVNKVLENACIDAQKKANILAQVCNQKVVGIEPIDYSFTPSSYKFASSTYIGPDIIAEYAEIGEKLIPEDITLEDNITFTFEIE